MGNLPYSTTSDELATLFGRVGAVTSAQVIMDRETGRSRGFGFVEMSDEDGRKAITELDGRRHRRPRRSPSTRPALASPAPAARGGGGGGGNRRY